MTTFPIAKYPRFLNRHQRSGDTTPPSCSPGGPDQVEITLLTLNPPVSAVITAASVTIHFQDNLGGAVDPSGTISVGDILYILDPSLNVGRYQVTDVPVPGGDQLDVFPAPGFSETVDHPGFYFCNQAARRVYIDDMPSHGWPDPGPSTYSGNATLIGRGEDAKDGRINRALYALHAAIDSVFEREVISPKVMLRGGAGAPGTEIDLTAGWGTTVLGLVCLGHVTATSAVAREYVALLRHGSPVKDALTLEPIYVDNIKSCPGGDTCYPLTRAGGYYPNPSAATGKVGSVLATNQITLSAVDLNGPSTVDNLKTPAACLFNYSLMTRLAQSGQNMHLAFAVVKNQSGVAPFEVTLNRGVSNFPPLGTDDEWKVNDVIYFTTVAYAPTLNLSASFTPQPNDVVLSGQWDRLGNSDMWPQALRALVRQVQDQRDFTPVVESEIPATASHFGWDGWQAVFRAKTENVRSAAGFMNLDRLDDGFSAGHVAYAGFLHGLVKDIGSDTSISSDPSTNPVTVAGDQVTLTLPRRFATVAAGPIYTTQLILGYDVIEIYDQPTDERPLGTWIISAFVNPLPATDVVTATVVNLDGTAATDLPAAGFIRLIRPLFKQSVAPDGSTFGNGTTLVGEQSGGLAAGPALTLINGTVSQLINGYQLQTDGTLDPVFVLYGDGDVWVLGDLQTVGHIQSEKYVRAGSYVEAAAGAGNGFQYTSPETFYHQVCMADGQNFIDPGSTEYWLYTRISDVVSDSWAVTTTIARSEYVRFPVNLPDDVTVTELIAHFTTNVDPAPIPEADRAKVRLFKKQKTGLYAHHADWVNADMPVSVCGGVQVDQMQAGGKDFSTFASTGVGQYPLAELIDNENFEYFVEVLCQSTAAGVSNRISAIRLKYTQLRLTGT